MARYKLLSMAFAGLLALGVTQAVAGADAGDASHDAAGAAAKQAGDPNVDGMDHSQLNHGVLGSAGPQDAKGAPAAQEAPASHGAAPTTIWKSPTR